MPIYDKPVYKLMREWAQQALRQDQIFGKDQPVIWFKKNYPDVKDSTVVTHVRAMSTNAPSRIHHKTVREASGRDLFFQLGPDQYRLYDQSTDPKPIYRETSVEIIDDKGGIDTLVETEIQNEPNGLSEFALEVHLQQFLVRNLSVIEDGLMPYFDKLADCLEVSAGGRRIDILARDKDGIAVVLELKVSRGYDRVIGQLLRYVAWVKRNLSSGEPVRGIIVAAGITEDLKLAVSELNNIDLFEYELQFSIQPVSLEEV